MSIIKLNNKGFTIIELLVATSVLSVILLLVTVMLINIGNLYYKDVNQAHVQDSVRSISDEITSQLELSPNKPQTGSQLISGVTINVYCIGPTRYSYVKSIPGSAWQMNTPFSTVTFQIPHLLWRDTPNAGCNPSVAADLTAMPPTLPSTEPNGADLVSTGDLLTQFCIGSYNVASGDCTFQVAPTSPYTVAIGVANAGSLLNLAGINSTCSVRTGDQYCAASSLVTTVNSRL